MEVGCTGMPPRRQLRRLWLVNRLGLLGPACGLLYDVLGRLARDGAYALADPSRIITASVALLAAAYMLATSLPRVISRLVGTVESHDAGGDVEINATADAGDDGDTNVGGGDGSAEVGLGGDDAHFLSEKATKLLARGLAGKEAAAQEVKEANKGSCSGGGSSARARAIDKQESRNMRDLEQIRNEGEEEAQNMEAFGD